MKIKVKNVIFNYKENFIKKGFGVYTLYNSGDMAKDRYQIIYKEGTFDENRKKAIQSAMNLWSDFTDYLLLFFVI